MKKLLRRLLKWTLRGGAALLVAAAVLAWFVMGTEPGAVLTLRLVTARLPIEIEFGDVAGRLAGPLELRDFRFATGPIEIEGERLVLDWRPLDLLRDRLYLESVSAIGIHGAFRKYEPDTAEQSVLTDTLVSDASNGGGLVLPLEIVFDDLKIEEGSFEITDDVAVRDIRLSASGTLDGYRANIEAVLTAPAIEEAALAVSGKGTVNDFEVESLSADVFEGELQGQGSVAWLPAVEWQLTVEANDIVPSRLAPKPEDWPGRVAFRARTAGSMTDGELLLRAGIDTIFGSLRGEPLAGAVAGAIVGSEYFLDEVDIDWGSVRIDATGVVSEQRLDLDFDISAPDLAAALPGSSGSVSAVGRLGGTLSTPVITVTASARDVETEVIDLEGANVRLDVDWNEGQRNEVFVTASGLEISGRAIDSLRLELLGTRGAHELLATAASEELNVTLTAAGGLTDWVWSGELLDLKAETREFGVWQLEEPTALTASEEAVSAELLCLVEERGGVCLEGNWNSVGGWRVNASLAELPLALLQTVLPDQWSLEGTVSGEFSASATRDSPERLEIDLYPGDGSLTYAFGDSVQTLRYREARIAVRANPDGLNGQITLQAADSYVDDFGSLQVDANLPPLGALIKEASSEGLVEALVDEWVLAASIEEAPLALANPFLPDGMSLSGSLSGEVETNVATDGELAGQFNLHAANASLHRLVGGEVRTVRIVDTEMSGRAGPNGLRGELALAFARPDSAPHATLSGSVGLPQYENLHQEFAAQALEASIDGRLDLSFLDALVEDLSGSIGQLDVELEIGGTVAEPTTSGHYLVKGQTDVQSLGLALRDIEIRAAGSAQGDFEIEGGVTSGTGRLAIQGRSPPIPSRESPTRLTVQGTDFLAVQTDQVTLMVSPDLEVMFTGEEVIVNGDLSVPRAAIEILELPETAVPVSNDVVFVRDTLVEQRSPLDVSANVRLILGEDVTFRGFGFTTHLDGTVVMTETPAQSTQGRGELVFREGNYRGFGQNLIIDPGRLVFSGPIDDPAVDVRAYRRADDGTRAGFLVTGTLQSPEVEVWSDPAKSQSEALSYILFGRSLAQGTESDRAQAGSEAAILGGNMLAMSMASKVGLDDARIETGNRREDAAFYAGKYLSPKLYVAYGVGLYEPVNVLRVRYIISRKLSLQAETGSRDSGDILYRIEF